MCPHKPYLSGSVPAITAVNQHRGLVALHFVGNPHRPSKDHLCQPQHLARCISRQTLCQQSSPPQQGSPVSTTANTMHFKINTFVGNPHRPNKSSRHQRYQISKHSCFCKSHFYSFNKCTRATGAATPKKHVYSTSRTRGFNGIK